MKIKLLTFAALGCLLVSSCKNNDSIINEEGNVPASFSASINAMTRVVGTSWESGDSIGIFMLQNATTSIVNSIANVQYGTSGDGVFEAGNADNVIYYPIIKSKVDFIAYYPYATLSGSASDPTFVVSNWNGVSQKSVDLLVAKATAYSATRPDVAFDFYHQFSKLALNISADTESGLTNADLAGLKVRVQGINAPATFHLLTQSVSYADTLSEDVFMYTAANGLSADAILPSVSGKSVVFVLASGDTYTWDISSLTFESGKKYIYNIALKAHPNYVTANLSSIVNGWNVENGGSVSLEQDTIPVVIPDSMIQTDTIGYEYVDLGLPSGLLWATKNLGANLISDYGSYFAWGETVGYASDVSHNFLCYSGTSVVYKYYAYTVETSTDESGNIVETPYSGYTKYMSKFYASSLGYKGFYDNKDTLDLSDDAAAVNWGGSWRMPTGAEWGELKNNCEWVWVKLNGVCGYKVSGTNGNFIFLPAAGERRDKYKYYIGGVGYYWGSTLYSTRSDAGSNFYFTNDEIINGYSDHYRYYGFSIRPVCSPSK